mgnify:CR=1 FL=1
MDSVGALLSESLPGINGSGAVGLPAAVPAVRGLSPGGEMQVETTRMAGGNTVPETAAIHPAIRRNRGGDRTPGKSVDRPKAGRQAAGRDVGVPGREGSGGWKVESGR